ncbi:MAG: 2OG-Fe(II) oxygenase [Endozoicomonas sp. (ex Botrylloides leachii)]|nr:2OG-Fe(II) oxygenase [Endozoicomonas sp. (ex Botrylloides leachii)]
MTRKKKFDYKKFSSEIEQIQNDYLDRQPFPYAFFDGLFDNELLDRVNSEIDQSYFSKDVRSIDGVEVKTRSDFEDNESLPDSIRTVFEIVNGGKFLNLVSQLTGIGGLISDPYYDGGGVNVIENGGTLAVHVDGTTQHRMQVARRINAILFLNDDWDVSWNGYHEQWIYTNKNLSPFDENQAWKCIRKVLPKKNRLYFFTTNDHSWHGHAGVLNVPEGVQRKSLISYFYTATRPEADLLFESPHRALFINNEKTLKEGAFDEVEVVL